MIICPDRLGTSIGKVEERVALSCRWVYTYLGAALDLLIDEGLIHDEDPNGNQILHEFQSYEELTARADALVVSLIDSPVLAVTAGSL